MIRLCCLLLIGLMTVMGPAHAEPPAVASLDAGHAQWLAEHRRWRVGVILQAPYVSYDRRLQQLSGLNVDLVNGLAKALSVDLTWRQYPDQAALENGLRKGDIDFAPGLTQTPSGLRLWMFSDPYMRVAQRVVGDRNGSVAVDLETLGEADRVAVRMPSSVADYLRDTYSNLNIQGVPLERQALQAVVGQQASYAVVDEAQLSRLSREPEFANLAVVGDIGRPQLLRIGSRRDWPQMAGVIEAGLRDIPAKDLEHWRTRWLQPKYPTLNESSPLWVNLCLLLAAMVLASIAILSWLRRQVRHLESELLSSREAVARHQAAEQALQLTQFSIDQSTVGILWVNWDSHVRYANRAAETMLGYPPGAVVDRPLIDFEPSLHMDRWLNLWKRARQGEDSSLSFETDCLRADGSVLPADVSLSFLRFHEGEYLVVYVQDVTERRRASAALQESEARLLGLAEQLRDLTAHLESVREEEKARIAREVHDELGQMLTVLKLETSMCELAYAQLDPGLQERLNSMKKLIAQLFQLVRDVATALRPPILDAGIGSAIEWQARRFETRTQIPCLVQVPEHLPALSDGKAIGLFRILQEALTNVMRHAQAHTVDIQLIDDGVRLSLSIIDDGVGFDPRLPSASFGLVGMRERVLMLGGDLQLDSAPGEGTQLRVSIPWA